MHQQKMKALYFTEQSEKRLEEFPEKVKKRIMHVLLQVQEGIKNRNTKSLSGSNGVREIVSRHDGNTYRTFYTTKFKGVVFVLHAFQKKAKHGIKTPRKEIKLAQDRMKVAQEIYDRDFVEK